MITIIGTLFFVGTGSIIMSIITELPPSVPYKRPENKVSLSAINGSILSGIDVEDSQNNFEIEIDDDLLEG
jgi:hypothetical protein|tara:strand:- start:696 stop:908 length:213 start_codon:yes stop_codon:yes gene_type:complete